METTLTLNTACINANQQGVKGIKKELIQSFKHSNEFRDLLEHYVREEIERQGTCDIVDWTISEETFKYRNHKGSFMVDIYYMVYFGCNDLNRYKNHYLDLSFKLNLPDQSVTFEYQELPEREPDEY